MIKLTDDDPKNGDLESIQKTQNKLLRFLTRVGKSYNFFATFIEISDYTIMYLQPNPCGL